MIDFKNSYSSIHFFPVWHDQPERIKKYLYWFGMFCLFMAVLELGQDYVSSVLNENSFRMIDSISYKLFWPLFIPFSIILAFLLTKTDGFLSDTKHYVLNAFLISAFALLHLFIFSLVLFGISKIIHINPWPLDLLITEKLSTRLYLGLSVYIFIAGIHFFVSRKKPSLPYQKSEEKNHLKKISVKNGQSSTLVDTDEIKWISSDGPYLFIHTDHKKHVVVDSLKNIITTLPGNFKRIHRSTIVNIDQIQELKSRGNGDYDVMLDNKHEVRLSRNYTKPLKGLLL